MIRHMLVGAAMLALAGCGSAALYTTPETPRQASLELNATYAEAANTAGTYTSLPRCPAAKICSDQSVVDQIKKADNSAYNAVKKASDELKALPAGASTVSLIVAGAKTSLDAFVDIANRYGVK